MFDVQAILRQMSEGLSATNSAARIGHLESHTRIISPAGTPPSWCEFYFPGDLANPSREETRRAAHDFASSGIPPGLNQPALDQTLATSFVPPLLSWTLSNFKGRTEPSLRLAVTDWIMGSAKSYRCPYHLGDKETQGSSTNCWNTSFTDHVGSAKYSKSFIGRIVGGDSFRKNHGKECIQKCSRHF